MTRRSWRRIGLVRSALRPRISSLRWPRWSKAARLLGLTRAQLRSRLEKHGLASES